MTVLELRFPAGRFHATPWGHHVNEGAVEWPPSPWRIIRALIATWYLKARRDEEISERTIRALADALLSQPPVFRLPSATTAHTRHYMPGKGDEKPKVFDTFIQIAENAPLLIAWDIDLPAVKRDALQTLAGRLGYFGRAESLVEGCVLDALPPRIEETHRVSKQLLQDEPMPEKTEIVRLLAPMSPDAYLKWREEFLKAYKQPSAGSKKKTGKTAKAEDVPEKSIVPPDLFTALHADTGELQAAGWNLPPGAQFVNYTRPENAFAPATRQPPRQSKARPTVARYAVASTVPPSMTRALSVAEQIHSELVRHSNGHPIFTGAKSKDHRHAHIFCESIENPLCHITHVTVYAPDGFDDSATTALRKLQWIWGFKGHGLNLVLHGIGKHSDFDCHLFGKAKVWRSLTPFISTRHVKTFRDGRPKIDASTGWQVGSAAHDLLRLTALAPQTANASIRQEKLITIGDSRTLRCLQFQTLRQGGGGSRGHDVGSSFTITFQGKVTGPLAFGYGSHFSLGLFLPIIDSDIA